MVVVTKNIIVAVLKLKIMVNVAIISTASTDEENHHTHSLAVELV